MLKITACRINTGEMQAAKAADTTALQRAPGDISAFMTPKTFLNQEEIILAHTSMCCLLLP